MLRPLFILLLLASCTPEPDGERPTKKPDPTSTTSTTTTTTATTTMPLPGVSVVINELMPRNDSSWMGPEDDKPDYIELLNVGELAVDLERLSLSNLQGDVWTGGGGRLQPGERMLLASGDGDKDTHLGFSIHADSDEITLTIDDLVVDQALIEDMAGDVALARIPDAEGELVATAWPSPGLPNGEEASPTTNPANETVFLTTEIHQINFYLTPQAFNRLDGWAENTVQAAVDIDGISFDAVGLRLKGSASFNTMDGKPAFKVDMNKGVPGTRYRGLKGFNLHNGNVFDPTRTRDYITYKLARESGIMAPRVGWAEVYFNGYYYGIYMIIEQSDDVMINHHFPNLQGVGVMLEPNESSGGGWGWGDFGTGNVHFDYEEGPQPPDPEVMEALTRVDQLVSHKATDANVAELWSWADKENVLTYMAWETVTSHTDGYKAPNNWRVFIHPDDKLVHLVPAGAEWTWSSAPQTWWWGGNLADWCLSNTGCKRDYAERVLLMAERVDTLQLRQEFIDVHNFLLPTIQQDPRSPHTNKDVTDARNTTLNKLKENPKDAHRDVCNTFPALCP